ncbi:MAG: hypothetical protein WCW47_02495 [Candidatus Paceibacterota bacterium]|jgi:hypothetical protein
MEFEKSSIERLKRTLYSRNENVVPKEKRTPVSGKEVNAPTDWGTKPSFDIPIDDTMTKRNHSFFNKFLIGSFVFFFVALAVAVFIFFGGMNTISSNNLNIKIVAPSSMSSGEELLVELSIINDNRADLEQVAFFVDYPEGALSVGENKPLSRDKVDLGVISSGGSKDYVVRAILSGEKETVKTFHFKIEYKVKGSNAVFSKEKTYDVIISSSPIILDVSYPKEINSGQEVNLSIDLISNSNVIIKNSLIKIEYPYGFTYKNSNIKPSRDNSVWNTGDLKNGDKKTLLINGVLVGQNLEDRSFKISAGTQKPGTTVDFETPLATSVVTIGIRKSFFDLVIDSEPVSVMGYLMPVTIKWQNILPDKILNTNIVATISGNIFDRTTVKANDGGFYRSVDDTILWDKNSTSNLTSISPGDSGEVSFLISSLRDSIQTKSIKNPHIDVNIKSTGDRSGTETGIVSSSENITIKISSSFVLTVKAFRNLGPFSNIGPIPPRADKESTYTVVWTLTNANNDLKDTLVTAVLPAGVEWKNEISPIGEKLSFNQETRVLSWNIGNVSLGTGFTYSPKEVYFKIGIIPSVSQINSIPNLLSKINLITTDTYTETQLTSDIFSVTTQYSDPSYKSGDNMVVK